MSKRRIGLAAAVMLATAGFAQAQDCEIKIGLVMELTGPAGEYGQAGAKSVEMAFRSKVPVVEGDIRGNRNVNDWYFFHGFKLLMHLEKQRVK